MEFLMPWFPDFVGAVELARRQTQQAGRADPVMQYFTALDAGDAGALENAWPGDVVIYDPRAGEVRGHRELRRFVKRNQSRLAGLKARSEPVASTTVGARAVVELLAHLTLDGQQMSWPVAVVVESPDDRSVVFRTYCSQLPSVGSRRIRPPILAPGEVRLADVVGRHQTALDAGDTDAILTTFEAGGYVREPIGPHAEHRGTDELRSFYAARFDAGGGIGLELCASTDDGVRCALEYNCVRWGSHQLTPQAGMAVFERGPDGLLAAARFYDDVEAPG